MLILGLIAVGAVASETIINGTISNNTEPAIPILNESETPSNSDLNDSIITSNTNDTNTTLPEVPLVNNTNFGNASLPNINTSANTTSQPIEVNDTESNATLPNPPSQNQTSNNTAPEQIESIAQEPSINDTEDQINITEPIVNNSEILNKTNVTTPINNNQTVNATPGNATNQTMPSWNITHLAETINGKSINTAKVREYLALHNNFTDLNFTTIKDSQKETTTLKIGAVHDTIKGYNIEDKGYVIHLIGCQERSNACVFLINGITTQKLSPDNTKGAANTFQLNDKNNIKINSITYDYCDGRRFCDDHYEAYNIVSITTQ